MLRLPQTPRGRVTLYGGGAALILLAVWLIHRHNAMQAAAADTSGLGLVEDPYANIGPSPEYGYGSTFLSPVSSGAAAGDYGNTGGTVTTYTPEDLLAILGSLQQTLPTPAATPTPTPNTTPTDAPYQPGPPAPPAPAPAPPPGPAPAPPPRQQGNGCPPDYPQRSARGCFKDCGHDECRGHRVCRNHGHCYRNGERVTLSVDCTSKRC